MIDSDFDRMVDLLNAIADTVGAKRPSDLALGIYWNTLRRFDLGEVQHALQRHVENTEVGQFMPKPADIIRQIEGGEGDNAAAAWQRVILAIERHGPYARIVFDDPAIHAALQVVGWYGLCTADYQQIAFRQRDFEQAYRMNIGTRAFPSLICAIPSGDSAVVYIGDPEKARQVQALGYDKGDRTSGAITAGEAVGRMLQ